VRATWKILSNTSVRRTRDKSDSRRVSLALTAKGRTLDTPTDGTVEQAVERLLGSSKEREIASVIEVLDRFTVLLNGMSERND
jgi:DNA-binding MarR family transcriptional regulator